MEEPETWRWIWLIAAVGFGLGEMISPGSFFLAPFALGAAVAALAAFAGASLAVGWAIFVVVSLGSFAALRPLARRLDRAGSNPAGVGAGRLIGESGVVLQAIPSGANEVGIVRVGREEWRAQAHDGAPIPTATPITVIEVAGTRVIVAATSALP